MTATDISGRPLDWKTNVDRKSRDLLEGLYFKGNRLENSENAKVALKMYRYMLVDENFSASADLQQSLISTRLAIVPAVAQAPGVETFQLSFSRIT